VRGVPLLIAIALGLLLVRPSPTFAQARPLAAWLDDADTLKPQTGFFGISVDRWASPTGGETDLPVFDIAVGLAKGVQVSASVPIYRASYTDGFNASGLGDTYLVAKVRLVNGDENLVGVAVSPLLEILSDAELRDPTLQLSRVNWALPVSIQVSGDQARAYVTTGYFSRGAVFAGGAVELTLSTRLTVGGEINYSYATRVVTGVDVTGLNRSRTDAEGSVFVQASPAVSLYASFGRTISAVDVNGATFIASAGVNFSFSTRSPLAQLSSASRLVARASSRRAARPR
jgi:hypothetical protein